MTYEEAHQTFMKHHLNNRGGERKGRLARGHKYAEQKFLEQVWWPVTGSFDYLHPEYEVSDWNRKSIYLDFAYITPLCRLAIECDGYQSHVKDMDREKFSYSLNRDTFLTGMDWRVVHFSFDDIDQRPELCRMLLKLILAPHLMHQATNRDEKKDLHPIEREIVALTWRHGAKIKPRDVSVYLAISYRTSKKWIEILCAKGMLSPIPGKTGTRIGSYQLSSNAIKYLAG